MALMDRIKQAFRAMSEQQVKGKLPFVHLFGYEKAYGKPHPQQYDRMIEACKSWVYACAWKNGTSVAKCKLNLFKQSMAKGEEQLDPIDDHPFLDLMKSVNPFSNQFELKTITQIYLELTGNAYWYMPKSVLGIPYMIWNLPPQWMKVVPSKERFISGYILNVPNMGKAIPFEEDEIVHFKFPSPFDMFYGISPTYAAMYGVDLNSQVKTWAINFFLNNAQPSGVLQTEEGLNDEQYQRLRDNWNRKYRGSKNAGKIAILEQGLKYAQIGSDISGASFDGLSKSNRDEILAMFGVPASKLGLVEDVNRANAEANDYTYQKETILPRLTLMEEKINEKIIPMYDVGILAKFDNPVPKDLDSKLKERESNINSGFASIDEERIKEGLAPYNLPETSVPLISFSQVPAGQPKPEMNNFNVPQDNEDEKSVITKAQADRKWEMFVNATDPQERLFSSVLKRYFQRQHSSVMKRLSQYKSIQKDLYGNIVFNENEANEELKTLSRNNIRQAYITGLSIGMRETSHDINFELFEPNIRRAVEDRMSFFAEKVNQTTARLLKEELQEGLGNGETIGEISKRVDKVFSYSEDYRSRATARTEVIGATNEGQIRSYREAGFTKKKWLTARDERVRHSHQIDGQAKLLNEPFVLKSGVHIQFPADRTSGNIPAKEVINCRCTILPMVK